MTTYSHKLRPTEQPHPLDWAVANIDYGRCPTYETPFRTAFSAKLFPFWCQPLADMHSATVREVVVRKCTRASASESFAFTDMRFSIVHDPQPMLYMTNDIQNAKRAMDERIKRGMGLSLDLAREYQKSKETTYIINFPGMDLVATWSRNEGAFKQSGYSRIYCDEVSTYQSFVADMIRRRADYYPFHHIAFISSVSPTRKGDPDRDPIILLYNETNQCKWFMPDPGKKKRKRFNWLMSAGEGKKRYGIMWPKEAKRGDEWDLDMVRDKAYFLTEHGTRITNDQRIDLTAAGEWLPTAKAKRDDTTGYWPVAPMIPTAAGDFGELAARFLAAKYKLTDTGTKEERFHNSVRVFLAESFGEAHRDTTVSARDHSLDDLEAPYQLKNIYVPDDCGHGIILTMDVQKYHIWHLAHVWSRNRKTDHVTSALLNYGTAPTFADINAIMVDMNPSFTGLDIGYAKRQTEVADLCAMYTDQEDVHSANVLAMRGNNKAMHNATDAVVRDAFEGKAAHGESNFLELAWDVDVFRTGFIDALNGDSDFDLVVPTDHGDDAMWLELIKQWHSTSKVDGEWIVKRHGQDHLFDCVCMQLALARYGGIIQ